MTIAFISDLHLDPDQPASIRLLTEFLDSTACLLDRLYILGDLFEYWIGDDASTEMGQSQVELGLNKVTAGGTPIYLLHGNRDFLLGELFEQRTGCKILADPSVIELGEKRVLLTHGDALCTDDIEHLAWRQQFLSAKWQQSFLAQSVTDRITYAKKMRTQSKLTKQSKLREYPGINHNALEQLMRQQQTNILIHGHTHIPGVHEFELDGHKMYRYVLGEWHHQPSVLYYHNECFYPNQGQQNPEFLCSYSDK